jgi:hypothetical protein
VAGAAALGGATSAAAALGQTGPGPAALADLAGDLSLFRAALVGGSAAVAVLLDGDGDADSGSAWLHGGGPPASVDWEGLRAALAHHDGRAVVGAAAPAAARTRVAPELGAARWLLADRDAHTWLLAAIAPPCGGGVGGAVAAAPPGGPGGRGPLDAAAAVPITDRSPRLCALLFSTRALADARGHAADGRWGAAAEVAVCAAGATGGGAASGSDRAGALAACAAGAPCRQILPEAAVELAGLAAHAGVGGLARGLARRLAAALGCGGPAPASAHCGDLDLNMLSTGGLEDALGLFEARDVPAPPADRLRRRRPWALCQRRGRRALCDRRDRDGIGDSGPLRSRPDHHVDAHDAARAA